LHGLANAAIDVSDGLLADLGHVLEASGLAASLYPIDLPPAGLERDCLLSGGDDYELVFTAAAVHGPAVAALAQRLSLPLTRLGTIENGEAGTIRVFDQQGRPVDAERRGFDHFS
jgi:thiamine-monophosphate kinase